MTKTFFTDYAIQISEIAGKREVKIRYKSIDEIAAMNNLGDLKIVSENVNKIKKKRRKFC